MEKTRVRSARPKGQSVKTSGVVREVRDVREVEGKGNLAAEIAREKFADAIVNTGLTQGEAYLATHPKCNLSGGALRVKACEYAKTPAVAAEIEAVRAELRSRNAAAGDRLVGYLIEEIDKCYRQNETLVPVMDQAKLAAKVLGLEKTTVDVNAKVGPYDPSQAQDKLAFLARKAGK